MSRLTRLSCILLCSLPLAALADPVTITTRSAGTIRLDATVLGALGMQDMTQSSQLPFDMQMRSVIDPAPAAPGYGTGSYDLVSDITVDLLIGGMRFHFAGAGFTDVNLYSPDGESDIYLQRITILPPASSPYALQLTNYGRGPLGGFGAGGALWPREVDAGDGIFRILAYESGSNAPNFYDMIGTIDTFEVQVAGTVTAPPPVPEPAHYGMLAAGVAVLGWRRRRALSSTA